ncbi:uncharacterized protein [Apostichopus japonicus]|uniref:uncharacterized protein n=1 Tax=Stichopus japonicus TaxID=307972 RepID=UPI003AB57B72
MSSSLLQVCLAIQVFLVAVYGCTPAPSGGSTRSNFQITYKKEDVQIARADRAPPARIGKRSLTSGSDDINSGNFFLKLDNNEDGLLDVFEWLRAPYYTKLVDFAMLLKDVDLNGDEMVSMEEFKTVKVTMVTGQNTMTTPR